ncbi:MAG: hypothetical protein M3362_10160, partial [Acidobacteriota bacterium]|nr:hypothetical protein [Acidobacteriota bacterium]
MSWFKLGKQQPALPPEPWRTNPNDLASYPENFQANARQDYIGPIEAIIKKEETALKKIGLPVPQRIKDFSFYAGTRKRSYKSAEELEKFKNAPQDVLDTLQVKAPQFEIPDHRLFAVSVINKSGDLQYFQFLHLYLTYAITGSPTELGQIDNEFKAGG